MAKKEKNGWVGIILGPIIVFVSLIALWKNETRFDYFRAAEKTTPVFDLQSAEENQIFSFSGSMDQTLQFDGEYVEFFKGYLVVYRSAEIYAWEEDEDDEGGSSTWSLNWTNSVESNSRNSGVQQTLKSEVFIPAEFAIDDLIVGSKMIEFVDKKVYLNVNQLTRSRDGKNRGLVARDNYLYLAKHRSRNLGDERVFYRGIRIPPTATYFGKYLNGRGIPDDKNKRTGMINQIIQDTGILHHLVAGERPKALQTMKAHIARVKWIVRAVGSAVTVMGFIFLFGSIARFLFRIPIIGPIAELGFFILAFCIGLPLAMATITAGYFFNHPLFLFAAMILLIALVGVVVYYRSKGKKTQTALKHELDQKYGHPLETDEIKELEFQELVQLALSDSTIDGNDLSFLKQWSHKQRWDDAKFEKMIENAKSPSTADPIKNSTESHLQNLIRLALADGTLSNYEIRTIRRTAQMVGYGPRELNKLMDSVSRSADLRKNMMQST